MLQVDPVLGPEAEAGQDEILAVAGEDPAEAHLAAADLFVFLVGNVAAYLEQEGECYIETIFRLMLYKIDRGPRVRQYMCLSLTIKLYKRIPSLSGVRENMYNQVIEKEYLGSWMIKYRFNQVVEKESQVSSIRNYSTGPRTGKVKYSHSQVIAKESQGSLIRKYMLIRSG